MNDDAVLALLASARDLLIEAGRLNGEPDVTWHVSKVTKADRPPLTISDDDLAAWGRPSHPSYDEMGHA